MSTKLVVEKVRDLNTNPELMQTDAYRNDQALRIVLQYAFDRRLKMKLPPGKPPYKQDPAPLALTPANLNNQIRRLYIFCRDDLPLVKREQLFIQMLETLHASECDLLIAIKDQSIPRVFKNLTPERIVEWGIVPKEWVAEYKDNDTFRQEGATNDTESDQEGKHLTLKIEDKPITTKEHLGNGSNDATTAQSNKKRTPRTIRRQPSE